jgi:hypothetical protein
VGAGWAAGDDADATIERTMLNPIEARPDIVPPVAWVRPIIALAGPAAQRA